MQKQNFTVELRRVLFMFELNHTGVPCQTIWIVWHCKRRWLIWPPLHLLDIKFAVQYKTKISHWTIAFESQKPLRGRELLSFLMRWWHPLKARKVSYLHVPVYLLVAAAQCFKDRILTSVSEKFILSTLICVRNFSALLSSVQPASLTLSSSTDVMEIVTRLRLPYKLHYNGSPDLKHTLSHMHMRPAI